MIDTLSEEELKLFKENIDNDDFIRKFVTENDLMRYVKQSQDMAENMIEKTDFFHMSVEEQLSLFNFSEKSNVVRLKNGTEDESWTEKDQECLDEFNEKRAQLLRDYIINSAFCIGGTAVIPGIGVVLCATWATYVYNRDSDEALVQYRNCRGLV